MNNPLPSKSTLKYLVYCQVFCKVSKTALVFYYCISSDLPGEKTNTNVAL